METDRGIDASGERRQAPATLVGHIRRARNRTRRVRPPTARSTRRCQAAPTNDIPMPIRAILTDIEGTTSGISFVKDVLFPYARRALPGFVATRGQEPDVRRWLDAVAAENGGMCSDAMIVEVLQGWI